MLAALDRAIDANRAVRGRVDVVDPVSGAVVETVILADREPDLQALRRHFAAEVCAGELVGPAVIGPARRPN